ncbi:MAG: hypothetical protein IJ794_17815 [Lachnospiraceae bacterium]|nr:hypothetical protein [Lachnospiraceae bacterium]
MGENTKTEIKRVITSREMLDAVLREIDFASKKETELSEVYCLMEFEGHVEPLLFSPFRDTFFESDCSLLAFPLREEELEGYVRYWYKKKHAKAALQYEKTMQRGAMHYEINCFQSAPFLTFPCTLLGVISKTECLDWLIQNHGEN